MIYSSCQYFISTDDLKLISSMIIFLYGRFIFIRPNRSILNNCSARHYFAGNITKHQESRIVFKEPLVYEFSVTVLQ